MLSYETSFVSSANSPLTMRANPGATIRITRRALQYRGYYDYYNDPQKYPLETLPPVSSVYPLLQSLWRQSESSPPQQYDESSLVKTLESTGIGRPSTYASIVGTLYGRNYTETTTIDSTKKEIRSLALKRNDEIVEGTLTQHTPKQTRRIVLILWDTKY